MRELAIGRLLKKPPKMLEATLSNKLLVVEDSKYAKLEDHYIIVDECGENEYWSRRAEF